MKVLVACEFSQIVTEAFTKKGHYAMSCDLLPAEKEYPHYQGDILDLLSNTWDEWDLMIAHPPCTYLCRHRSRWHDDITQERATAKRFFVDLISAKIPKICVENPVPLKAVGLPRYNQIIQPWQFGHDYSKKTCLWLKNLPLLKPTDVVELTYYWTPNGRRFTKGWYMTPRNMIARSRTFSGIAEAMANQWSNLDK